MAQRKTEVAVTPAPELDQSMGDAAAAKPGGFISIVSRTAGFRRAGIVHPLRAIYPLDYFTQEQLDAINGEPELELMAFGGEPVPADTAGAGVGMPFVGDYEF